MKCSSGVAIFRSMWKIPGESMIQIAASGADTPQETIYQAYFYAIAQAKNTVYIETPYFIPDESILTALKAAAMAGVDVRIIFPQKSDHATVHEASLSYLEELMRLGAKVYFYQKGFIHSKMLLVDNETASVGTANMDIRSFMLNSEINAFIYDKETVERLYRVFADDLTDCRAGEKSRSDAKVFAAEDMALGVPFVFAWYYKKRELSPSFLGKKFGGK